MLGVKLRRLRAAVKEFDHGAGSRMLFGNLAGVSNNRLGRSRWRMAQRKAAVGAPATDLAADLRAEGYSFYSAIDEARLGRVRRDYLKRIEDPSIAVNTDQDQKIAAPGATVYRSLINSAERHIPSILDLIDDRLRDYLQSYYGTHFRVHSVAAWRNFHVPADVLQHSTPYSLTWHCDRHPIDTLKLFVVLNDIGEADGPLHFVNRSRTRDLIRKGFRNRNDYGLPDALLEDNGHLRKLTGPAATAAFCDTTTCLHRAGIPLAGRSRDILQFRFESSDHPYGRSGNASS